MNAELISIGDELLIGQVVNSNASWLGEHLSMAGLHVRRVTVVGDDLDGIVAAYRRAWEENDIVVSTGGLGPTHDDRTREALLAFFETSLIVNGDVLADIKRFLHDRGRTVSERNRDQAMVPASARVIRNYHGTAPGYHFTEGEKHLFVLPGVPYEMKAMVEQDILPFLASLQAKRRAVRTILTTGIPESTLADVLAGIDTLRSDTSVAFLPSPLGVRIRLTCVAESDTDATTAVDELETMVRDRAGEWIFGTDNETLEAHLGTILVRDSKTLSVAESCTGGLITDRVTNIPGSSRWFDRGAVVYSNQSKTDMLGVDPHVIERFGAVSREVCLAMAAGIRRLANSDYGLSTTGIAGPDGGTAEKPVGLVWIGLSTPDGSFAHAFRFGNDRLRTKQRAAQSALDTLRRHLLSLPPVSSL
ncbi:MAG: competence/damage-inducible protein A [Bacteroidia bacterium]|nr:competence/damage-inducible protein A [Bacteroidia bacterium]